MKENLVFTINVLASRLKKAKADVRHLRDLRKLDSGAFTYQLTKQSDELQSVKSERDRLKEELVSSNRLLDIHRAEYQKLLVKYELQNEEFEAMKGDKTNE